MITLLITSLFSCAVNKGFTEADKEQEHIYEFPGMTKDQLYIASNTWMVDIFRSAESVIQFSDKEDGVVMGKYVSKYRSGVYLNYWQSTMRIDLKDERARISFNNPILVGFESFGDFTESRRSVRTSKELEQVKVTWNRLIKEYEEAILNESQSDW